MKRILSLLVLLLCLFCLSASAEPEEMPDFTVQTLNGTFSLQDVLQEKKMVLINFFASWCGPCKMEFPYMEQAYEQYADSVAVLALSVEPKDSPDVLKKYADDLGLTFDVASDSELSLSARFTTGSIPVTVVVDRFGKIVLQEAGAKTSADDFLQLFDFLTSDYYTESVSLDGFPGPRAGVEGENAETLVSALGDDEHLTYLNPEDPFVWPMKAVEDGERLALSPSAGSINVTNGFAFAVIMFMSSQSIGWPAAFFLPCWFHTRRHSCRSHMPQMFFKMRVVPQTPPSLVKLNFDTTSLTTGFGDSIPISAHVPKLMYAQSGVPSLLADGTAKTALAVS